MSELRGLEQQLVNLKDQCWNLEQKISYLCECLGGVQTALERGGGTKDGDPIFKCPICSDPLPHHHVHDGPAHTPRIVYDFVPKPAPTAATVERFRVYGFMKSQYCVSPTGADDQYQNHFARFVIGEVVASPDGEGGWLVKLPNWRHWVCLTDNAYRALVDHNVRAGIWERT